MWLLVDPWNEFVRWMPGVTVVSDEETQPNFGYDQEFVVPAMSRVSGTLTTDDMQEIAIKLASVENLLASSQVTTILNDAGNVVDGGAVDGYSPTEISNNIFNPQNRSNSGDALFTPWIPGVVAGLTGFDLGLRVDGPEDQGASPDGGVPGAGVNVAVEITINVQDLNGNRFVPADSTQAQIGMPPTNLSPPGARF